MESRTFRKPGIHMRSGFIKTSSCAGRQTLGEGAHALLTSEIEHDAFEAGTTIDVDVPWGIHQHVGDARISKKIVKRSGTGEFSAHVLDEHTQRIVREHHALGPQCGRHLHDTRLLVRRDQPGPHAIQKCHASTSRHARE